MGPVIPTYSRFKRKEVLFVGDLENHLYRVGQKRTGLFKRFYFTNAVVLTSINRYF